MMLPGEMKMVKFSIEEREKYGIFDAEGWLVGVKESAPAEFKEAYEHDEKKEKEAWEQGIYL